MRHLRKFFIYFVGRFILLLLTPCVTLVFMVSLLEFANSFIYWRRPVLINIGHALNIAEYSEIQRLGIFGWAIIACEVTLYFYLREDDK